MLVRITRVYCGRNSNLLSTNFSHMKSFYFSVDVKTETNATLMHEGESRVGTFTMVEEGEKFAFKESAVRTAERVAHPEWRFNLLDRTKHGRLTASQLGVRAEFYIRHDEYKSNAELADILAREIDTMGDNLIDMNLHKSMKS